MPLGSTAHWTARFKGDIQAQEEGVKGNLHMQGDRVKGNLHTQRERSRVMYKRKEKGMKVKCEQLPCQSGKQHLKRIESWTSNWLWRGY